MTSLSPSNTKASFAPIADSDCRILILGSLPGDASLQQGHYYAHPRNAFWPICSEILGCNFGRHAFDARYQLLLQHHIALWDVIATAQRKGSLDSAIAQAQTNPLSQLISTMPKLQLVIFNGNTAAKHGNKLIPEYIQQAIAPSSSPAHTLKYEIKLERWRSCFELAQPIT